jgi:hypothetical protein
LFLPSPNNSLWNLSLVSITYLNICSDERMVFDVRLSFKCLLLLHLGNQLKWCCLIFNNLTCLLYSDPAWEILNKGSKFILYYPGITTLYFNLFLVKVKVKSFSSPNRCELICTNNTLQRKTRPVFNSFHDCGAALLLT